MTVRAFFSRLSEVTALCIIWAFGFYLAQDDRVANWTYGISIIIYVIFSILIFAYTKRQVDQDRMHSFNAIVSVSFLIKLLISVAIIWGIETTFHPVRNTHIFHYLVIYIIYTVFEVYFLTKLSYS